MINLGLKLSLDQEQQEELEYSLTSPYVIYELPMGFGKTALAIAIKQANPGARVLVVCPSGLKLNWKQEINKFLDNQAVTIIEKASDIYHPVDSDFVILSYSLIQHAETLFEWATIVIADEASSLKNMAAKRTSEFHRLTFENNIDKLYLMTGTPIKNRVWEFYSLIALCNYNPKLKSSPFLDKFPDHISFADHFSNRREFEKYIGKKRVKILNWDGLKNEDELKGWLKGIRRKRKPKTGPLIIKDILASEKANPELLAAFNSFMDGIGKSVMPEVKAKAARAKVPFTIEYVDSILEEVEKVVIVSEHVDSASAIAEHYNVECITGSMKTEDRQRLVNDFESGKSNILVGTIGTLKEGYTLVSAWNMVLNDYCWVPGDLDQLYARINRRGQTRQCIIHHILGSPQDEYILNRLAEKRDVIGRV